MSTPNGNLPPDQMQARAALAQAMAPQKWHCAVCVSARRAWEIGHTDVLQQAMERGQALGVPAAQFLPPELLERMPPLLEAVTLATVPGHGPAAVCGAHCPPVTDPGRSPLLVATAGLNMAQFADSLR